MSKVASLPTGFEHKDHTFPIMPKVRLHGHPNVVILTLVLLLGVSGCGIKGSPVAPGYAKPPAVSDLKYEIAGSQVKLTWSVPAKGTTGNHSVAGAKVRRLKQPLKNAACQDCPQTFAVIGNIPARSGTMQFQDTIDKGFGYYYQIVLYDAQNHNGEESNIVHVEN